MTSIDYDLKLFLLTLSIFSTSKASIFLLLCTFIANISLQYRANLNKLNWRDTLAAFAARFLKRV